MNNPRLSPNPAPRLGIIVPCYNEEEVFETTCGRLIEVLTKAVNEELIQPNSYICFVNDGSRDTTWNKIAQAHDKYPVQVWGINLARNYGHQFALLAGMELNAEFCQALVSIDADLQDDPDKIIDFVKKYCEGYEVVFGVRDDRSTDSWFKRNTAVLFYRLMQKMGAPIIDNHADYRLVGQRAMSAFLKFPEKNLFLRSLFADIGFPRTQVYYNRSKRLAGESKYPLMKMIEFAWNGISSYSIRPLRLIMTLGTFILLSTFVVMAYYFVQWFRGDVVPGWTSLVLPIYFFGGIQIFALGLVAEYIAKMFYEVKGRPRYLIDTFLK